MEITVSVCMHVAHPLLDVPLLLEVDNAHEIGVRSHYSIHLYTNNTETHHEILLITETTVTDIRI